MNLVDLESLRNRDRIFWSEDILRFSDTDQNGHINNNCCATMSESGRVGLFRDIARDVPMHDNFFVLAQLNISYRSELTYPGKIKTATWISQIKRTSLVFQQMIFKQDGTSAADVEAVCVLMAKRTRRPFEISGELRDRLASYQPTHPVSGMKR
jgi:acyl-CoA thioester hydrolase